MIDPIISHYPVFRDPAQRDKILEKLGEGGMGVVYKAEDTKLNPVVAGSSSCRVGELTSSRRQSWRVKRRKRASFTRRKRRRL